MSGYSWQESFDLEGWSPEASQGFALGVEWHEFYSRLMGGRSFSMVIRRANRQRLESLAARHGRFTEIHDLPSWADFVSLFVGDRGGV